MMTMAADINQTATNVNVVMASAQTRAEQVPAYWRLKKLDLMYSCVNVFLCDNVGTTIFLLICIHKCVL